MTADLITRLRDFADAFEEDSRDMSRPEYSRNADASTAKREREAADALERLTPTAEDVTMAKTLLNVPPSSWYAIHAAPLLRRYRATRGNEMTEREPCTHDIAERESACADGYCPLCLSAALVDARAALAQRTDEARLMELAIANPNAYAGDLLACIGDEKAADAFSKPVRHGD